MKNIDNKKLELYRKKIDVLDKSIVSGLLSRFSLVKKIGLHKKKRNMKIEDKNRENEILNKIKSKEIKKIYKLIFKLSKSNEC